VDSADAHIISTDDNSNVDWLLVLGIFGALLMIPMTLLWIRYDKLWLLKKTKNVWTKLYSNTCNRKHPSR